MESGAHLTGLADLGDGGVSGPRGGVEAVTGNPERDRPPGRRMLDAARVCGNPLIQGRWSPRTFLFAITATTADRSLTRRARLCPHRPPWWVPLIVPEIQRARRPPSIEECARHQPHQRLGRICS